MSVRQGNKIIAGGNSVTVDQVLDIDSPNAIANSAVTAGLNGKQATITGAATTITSSNLPAARAVITNSTGKIAESTVTSSELAVLHGITATTSELNILDGVTASTAELNILDGVTATASELNVLDGITASTTELNYTDGVTSNIQDQLNAKAADNLVVHLANAETITGVKTFNASPLVPTAAITSDDTTAASTAFVRDIMPAGVIVPFAGTTVPAGYLLCDGSAVSRTTYAALFAAIGTTYGPGDGNTTFNLPIIQGNTNANMIPTGTYDNLSWENNHTAPANGWFVAQLRSTATQAFIGLKNLTNGMTRYLWGSVNTANYSVFIPVRKGDVIQASATNMQWASDSFYRFYYAQNYNNAETGTIIKY